MPDAFYGITCEITCVVGGDVYVFEGVPVMPDEAAHRDTWVIIENKEGDWKKAVRTDDIRLIEVA